VNLTVFVSVEPTSTAPKSSVGTSNVNLPPPPGPALNNQSTHLFINEARSVSVLIASSPNDK